MAPMHFDHTKINVGKWGNPCETTSEVPLPIRDISGHYSECCAAGSLRRLALNDKYVHAP